MPVWLTDCCFCQCIGANKLCIQRCCPRVACSVAIEPIDTGKTRWGRRDSAAHHLTCLRPKRRKEGLASSGVSSTGCFAPRTWTVLCTRQARALRCERKRERRSMASERVHDAARLCCVCCVGGRLLHREHVIQATPEKESADSRMKPRSPAMNCFVWCLC